MSPKNNESMDKNNNIYQYKAPKSMNEEIHYFLIQGRITIKAFLLRVLLGLTLPALCFSVYFTYALPKLHKKLVRNDLGELVLRDATFKTTFYAFEIFTFYILPGLLLIFLIVQAIKRMHDTNRSGFWVLVPVYNLFLLLSSGTDGNNNFGINPRKQKTVKYFDELPQ